MLVAIGSDAHHFEWTETSECRRIAAIEPLASGHRVFVDDPWQFEHSNDEVLLRKYDSTGPSIATTKDITNPVRRLLFSIPFPSFRLEHCAFAIEMLVSQYRADIKCTGVLMIVSN